jgi:hypothetical protein
MCPALKHYYQHLTQDFAFKQIYWPFVLPFSLICSQMNDCSRLVQGNSQSAK